MKKTIFCLLILVLGIVQISCGLPSRNQINTDGAEVYITTPAPSPSPILSTSVPEAVVEAMPLAALIVFDEPVSTKLLFAENYIFDDEIEEIVVEEIIEKDLFNDAIPLSRDEQELLLDACEEFGVPYALALGLIETETNFRNITGDNGNSSGYMQIQRRFHGDRMDRLGVTDLMDPGGNFRVGLDFLTEQYNKYGDWGIALTVYNNGSYPGYITNYANVVLTRYANWQELVDNDA
jgi:soluble lytic murein transglycosylase-like protein